MHVFMHVRHCVLCFLPRGTKSWDLVCSLIMETYQLILSECTSSQCSGREEIEKQVITTHTNTTEGVYSVNHLCTMCCVSVHIIIPCVMFTLHVWAFVCSSLACRGNAAMRQLDLNVNDSTVPTYGLGRHECTS